MPLPDRPHHFAPENRVAGGASLGSTLVARLRQSALFRDYQQAFETITGLPLVLRESGSFRTPLQGSSRINPFCALMTRTNQTCAACLQLQQRLEEEATQAPKTLRCYAGLIETVVPVRVGDTILGYLQTGQVFLQAPNQKQLNAIIRVIGNAESAPDPPELKSAYFQSRLLTKKQYASIIQLLAIFAEHLAAVSNQLLIAEAAVESPVIARARAFIAAHQGEVLRLGDVAHAVNMSAYYLCKVFKQATGLTFTAYLSRARIESVKHSLLNIHARVSEVAFSAGFQSLSQFNRAFRRIAGETPTRYRERLHGLNGKPARSVIVVPPL